MGCDIHVFVEKFDYDKDEWVYVPPPDVKVDYRWGTGNEVPMAPGGVYYEDNHAYLVDWFDDRNYDLFALLADVRNGAGITPLGFTEGWPRDISETLQKEFIEHTPVHYEHTPVHYRLDHLINQIDTVGGVDRVGYLTEYDFLRWKASGIEPETWCGMISGPGIVLIDETEYPGPKGSERLHVHTRWRSQARVTERFREMLQEVEDTCGVTRDRVRVLMYFDS
jgi:hypothetical protein